MNKDLPWILEARKHIGVLEDISKSKHHPKILEWLSEMGTFNGEAKPWWNNDEVPWCGLAVGICLGRTNRYVVKEWYRANAWASPHLTKLSKPAYGCIIVMNRTGGGHTGFVVGIDQYGNLMVWGGNQSNRVSIIPFSQDRLKTATYWWPSVWRNGEIIKSRPLSYRYDLPLLSSDGKVSTNEA